MRTLERTRSKTGSSFLDSWIPAISVVVLILAFLIAGVCLFQEHKALAISIALIAAAAFWLLETLEGKIGFSFRRASKKASASLAAVAIIIIVAFLACLPTIHTYFLTDEFALIHAFHNLSADQFLQLLHMDTRRFVSGDSRQEFRPMYGLYYFAAYHLWSLQLLGYHLCEILLHALVSVLVFLIAKTVAKGEIWTAALAGILFAVQPPHAQAMSLIVGSVAECFPALFYLYAVLCFIRFRSNGRFLQLALSLISFIACLLTKESAVTLPVMLFFYDAFQIVSREGVHISHSRREKLDRWRKFVLPYVPYVICLFLYLTWRRRVLSSYLREDNWGSHSTEVAAHPQDLFSHFIHLASRVWQLLAFNFETLLPYSTVVIGLILALFLLWAFSLLRARRECARSVALVLYFGPIWYCITNLPYVIEQHVPYHLYLTETGLCIGLAFLAFPESRSRLKNGGYFRLLGMGCFLIASTIQMWSNEAQYARLGQLSARMAGQLAVGLRNIPHDAMVVISPGDSSLVEKGWGEGILPFSVEPPFTSIDLATNVHMVEGVDMSCCGVGEWWLRQRPMLVEESERPPNDQVVVYLLSWDENAAAFQLTSRSMQRGMLIDRLRDVLGSSSELPESIDDPQASELLSSLADLVNERTLSPLQK